ncbi:MAG: thioesterase family protein [Alphaproteobacteria bacterium]|nr:thioesterase family protein [Alphaproteobacteria bacterium]
MSNGQLLEIHTETVQPEWIDYNGHMNVAYYVLAFDHATDALFDHLGIGEKYRLETNSSLFVVESHITYDYEVSEGEPLRFTTQILDSDDKRLHFFHQMYHAEKGYLAATTELMSIHVDLNERKTSSFPPEIANKIDNLKKSHAKLTKPLQVGRVLAIKKG